VDILTLSCNVITCRAEIFAATIIKNISWTIYKRT